MEMVQNRPKLLGRLQSRRVFRSKNAEALLNAAVVKKIQIMFHSLGQRNLTKI